MNKLIFVAFLILFFVGGAMAYTAPSFEGQPIIVESSSDFYGSNEGVVSIDLNLDAIRTDFKDFFIKITGLNDTSTMVKEISVNKEKTKTISYHVSQTSKTKISQKSMSKTPVSIILEFDPQEIGVARKFNIELVDKDGVIIADLDPFLSGYDYRQEWCLNTDGISLSGDVTNDHAIYFDFSSNTDFQANASSDGNGIKMTDLSNNEYDFYFEADINDMWAEITETFDSSADTCGYVYYGGNDSLNHENKNATYPSSYLRAYNFTDSLTEDSTGNSDLTQSGTSTENSGWGIANNVQHDGLGTDGFTATYPTTWGSRSFIGLVSSDNVSRANYQQIWRQTTSSKSDPQIRISNGNLEFRNTDNLASNYSVSDSTRYHFIITDDESTSYLYVGGVERDSENASSYSLTNDTYLLRHPNDSDRGLDGDLDAFRYLNYIVSADEVKLLYNSDNDSLVTFSAQETGNNAPEVEITNPVEEEYFSSIDINFSVTELDGDPLDSNIYYSDVAGQKDTLIYEDTNLYDGTGVVCDDYNFINGSNCVYEWDILNIGDGNYFIDVSTSDGSDTNLASSQEFEIDQRKSFYGTGASFFSENIFTTTSTSYVDVFNFDFNHGFDNTLMSVACVFDTNSDSVGEIQGDYRVSESSDGVNYNSIGTSSVTMEGDSNFFNNVVLISDDFNSSTPDTNTFIKLEQKRTGGSGTTKEITLNNPSCSVVLAKDINGFDLTTYHYDLDQSTTSNTYVEVDSFSLPNVNYFWKSVGFGQLQFYQTVASGTPSLRFCIDGSCSSEYLRYVESGNIGSGSFMQLADERNPDTNVTIDVELKTTNGTGRVTSDLHNYIIATGEGETAQIDLNSDYTFSNTSFEEIASVDFNNKDTQGDFYGWASVPFSCSVSECFFQGFLRVQGTGFDQNSLIRRRTSNTTAGQVGFMSIPLFAENVSTQDDLNISLYAKTDSGTITLQGGAIAVLPLDKRGSEGFLSPSITALQDWTNLIINDSYDYNLRVEDPDGNCLNGTVDLNLLKSSDNSVIESYSPELVLNGDFCDANYTFNPLSVVDNNYYWVYSFTDEDGLFNNGDGINKVFVVDNNAPDVNVSGLVDQNFNSESPIEVTFVITDPSFTNFSIDLNYSDVNTQGTGTQVLIDEFTSTSLEILCSGTYATGSTCIYDLDLSGVADGNYFVLVEATNQRTGFDSSGEFSIYEGVSPTPTSDVNYTERYVNPDYDQKDGNVFYNSFEDYDLTEDEQRNIYLGQITFMLISILVFAGIGVFIIWKKR